MSWDDADFDRQESRIDDWLGDIEQRAERARALNRAMHGLAVGAASADRLVSVTVDAQGRLTDLQLDDGVRRHSGRWLAEQIMRTVAQAQERAAQQVEQAVTETVGRDSPSGQAIIASLRRAS